MAVLIPEVPGSGPNSERYVFERLGRELPEDWIILHSLGLPGHEKKIRGEADIVVLSTSGIFAIEVKGGQVSCSDGLWTYSGDFRPFTKTESPWAQAMGALGAVRDSLSKSDPRFRDVLFGYGVVMPYTEFTTAGTEIVPEVLLDRRYFRKNLSTYIQALAKYWAAELQRKQNKTLRGLTPEELRIARNILRPDLQTAFSLGSYLDGVESRLLHLTQQQIRISRRMAANPRTVVRGAAGTGKTVIALDRAVELSRSGCRVLYVCFNQLLAAHVRKSVGHSQCGGAFDVVHLHALYRRLIAGAGLSGRLEQAQENDPDFYRATFPELAVEALCSSENDPYDVIIVDEAQDLLTPAHLDALDLLLKDGLRRGRWHLFIDYNQNIYRGDIEVQVEQRLSEGAPAFDDLYENCRNTRQISVQTSIISGIDLPASQSINGPEAEIHYCGNADELTVGVENLIQQLLDQDVKLSDIVILSTRRLENSVLARSRTLAGRPVIQLTPSTLVDAAGVLFSTMHAFKGLERPVVIAVDMDGIGDPELAMLHYAGLSRARSLLHIFLSRPLKTAYEKQATAFGRRFSSAVR